MTHDLRAKLERATRLAEGATTPGERDAAEAAIKRLKKAMKRAGQDKPFQAPPVANSPPPVCRSHRWYGTPSGVWECSECGARHESPIVPPNVHFQYTGTAEGFQTAWDEFLNGKRREAPKRPGPVKFPNAGSAAYPRPYPRK